MSIRELNMQNLQELLPAEFCYNNNIITIDDGPNNNTYKILDVLDRNNSKAIFYLIGENMKQILMMFP